MKKSTLGVIGSVAFMVVVLIMVLTLWRGASADSSSTVADTSAYAPVDISGMKEQALSITSSTENNAGVPIAVPSGKMGKTNPFNAPE